MKGELLEQTCEAFVAGSAGFVRIERLRVYPRRNLPRLRPTIAVNAQFRCFGLGIGHNRYGDVRVHVIAIDDALNGVGIAYAAATAGGCKDEIGHGDPPSGVLGALLPKRFGFDRLGAPRTGTGSAHRLTKETGSALLAQWLARRPVRTVEFLAVKRADYSSGINH